MTNEKFPKRSRKELEKAVEFWSSAFLEGINERQKRLEEKLARLELEVRSFSNVIQFLNEVGRHSNRLAQKKVENEVAIDIAPE